MQMSHRVLLTLLSGAFSAAFSATLGLQPFPLLSAVLSSPDPAPANAAARAGTCYGGAEPVTLDLEVSDGDYGVAYDSPMLWVKTGSPCRDLNVRDPHNAAGPAVGQQVCTLVKVLLDGHDIVGWVDTCAGWQVLAKWVPEGRPFVLRAAIRPVVITVAS